MRTGPLRPLALALLGLGLLLAPRPGLAGDDWPQFRGPGRDGRGAAEGLLPAWVETRPRELWRRPIGGGYSGITVVGDRLYTLALEGGEEVALALDRATGERLWSVSLGASGEAFPADGPRASPTVAGGTVYVVSSQSVLAALEAGDGAVRWKRSLLGDEERPPRFGYSVSPLVDGDLLLLETGKPGEAPGVVALDRATGEVRWGALEGPPGYSSPIAVELHGVRQYVFFRRVNSELVSLSTAGEVLWRQPTAGLAIIVSPLFLPPDRFFVASSDDGFGGLMVRVLRDGEGFRTEEVWSERLMRNHFNTSVVVDGHLYGFDNATFRCLDAATGERRWAQRGLGKGSLVAAGDLLFVLADDGTLALVRATPEAYVELGRIAAMRGRAWTAPSLADGRLYLRDFDEIVAYDVSGEGGGEAVPAVTAAAPAPPAGERAVPSQIDLEEVIARHVAARGGAERWRRVTSLAMSGSYAAFSEVSPFELLRRRGDLYRLSFEMLGGPAIRARDERGAWGRHPLLFPEPQRVEEDPYKRQFEREAWFGPALLDYRERGATAALAGAGEIEGRPTVDVELTLPDGATEIWHLDPESFLEVAVDSTVMDFTQLPEPMRQRAFYDDFREADGLVLPHRVDLEFGARLESMVVERVEVDAEFEPADLRGPEPAPAEE